MPVPRLIVVGASAGGVEALCRLLSLLPADLPAAILVVMHVAPAAPSVLPRILARAGSLPVEEAMQDMPIEAGRVYVAPGDHHLIVDGDSLALVRGPRENGHRPALDPLFRSAAREHGPRVAGVVLSGNLSDGTHGLAQVGQHGGLTLVQDPAEALFDGMPRSAIAEVRVDAVLPLAGLAAAIERFARAESLVLPVPEVRMHDRLDDVEQTDDREEVPQGAVDEVELDGVGGIDIGRDANVALGGALAPYTCPECRGNLWEITDDKPVRFRCRVGHSYDEPTLLDHKDAALEAALWTAVTALEENASLARQVADRAGRNGRRQAAARFASRAVLFDKRARTVREVLGALPATEAPHELEVHR
jgi:two-component system, chemotaxis family, protein-glutamate methylesterase/glutaminase